MDEILWCDHLDCSLILVMVPLLHNQMWEILSWTFIFASSGSERLKNLPWGQHLHIFLSTGVVCTNVSSFSLWWLSLAIYLKQKNSVLLKSKLPCQSHPCSWCKYQWSCNFWHTFSMTHPVLSQLILHNVILETNKWVLGFWIILKFPWACHQHGI